MPLKLIYTSAPRLLQAGRSGFGTVAMSRGIPTEVVKAAENFSQFSRQSGMESARVVYSYRTVRCGDGVRHVLSCIRDAGADYSGRTNHLAQHLVFDDREAASCASSGFTPAGVILGTEWPSHDGYCGWIESAPQWASSAPEPTWPWWAHYSSSPECRFNLCTQSALRGSVFVYGKGLEKQTENEAKSVLCLFAESQLECPNRGWGVTFTTSYEPNDELSDFKWVGVPENSPLLSRLETSGGREWVTLESPPVARPVPKAIAKPVTKQTGQDDGAAMLRDKSPSVGAPVLVATNKVASPPPFRSRDKEPLALGKASLFGVRKIAISALSLVALIAAVLLLGSIFAPIKVELAPASLRATYSGSPHAVQILKGPAEAKIRYAQMGMEGSSLNPPINAGTYELTLEVPGWFKDRLLPLNEVLVIDKQTPEIQFPQQLEFTHTGKEHAITPNILPREAQDQVQILYKSAIGQHWTNSAPRNVGEYTVQVVVPEAQNLSALTNQATFTIKEPSNALAAATTTSGATQSSGPTLSDAPSSGVKEDARSKRIILLPQHESASRLSQLSDFPSPEGTSVQYLEAQALSGSGPHKWSEPTMMWRKLENGLLLVKPNTYAGKPLYYKVTGGPSGDILELLELVEGAGAYMRNLYELSSFYVERTTQKTNVVRLGPSGFFSSNLETLPSSSYFEVSFKTTTFSPPMLVFRKTTSGWEANLPLDEIRLEEKNAIDSLNILEARATTSYGESYYNEVKQWALVGLDDQDHEAVQKLSSLQPNLNILGEKPEEVDVVKHLVVDMARTLEPLAPLPVSGASDKEDKSNGRSAGQSKVEPKPHELNANQLDQALRDHETTAKVLRTAREWMEGRKKFVPDGDGEKAKVLRGILSSIGKNVSGLAPKMVREKPRDMALERARNEKASIMNKRAFFERLGVTTPQPSEMQGQLAFVYPEGGAQVKIILDSKVSMQLEGAVSSNQ